MFFERDAKRANVGWYEEARESWRERREEKVLILAAIIKAAQTTTSRKKDVRRTLMSINVVKSRRQPIDGEGRVTVESNVGVEKGITKCYNYVSRG